jgi:hypothetical protein
LDVSPDQKSITERRCLPRRKTLGREDFVADGSDRGGRCEPSVNEQRGAMRHDLIGGLFEVERSTHEARDAEDPLKAAHDRPSTSAADSRQVRQ